MFNVHTVYLSQVYTSSTRSGVVTGQMRLFAMYTGLADVFLVLASLLEWIFLGLFLLDGHI